MPKCCMLKLHSRGGWKIYDPREHYVRDFFYAGYLKAGLLYIDLLNK